MLGDQTFIVTAIPNPPPWRGPMAVEQVIVALVASFLCCLATKSRAPIPGHGQLQLDAAALEAGARIAAGVPRYVVKVDGTFTGYLQHFVTAKAAGAISDMTPVCLM